MKEKEYRHVECPTCKTTLRLTVEPKSYGRVVEVKCGKCSQSFKTQISLPEKTGAEAASPSNDEDRFVPRPLIEQLGKAHIEALEKDEAVHEALAAIHAAGFTISAFTIFSCSTLDGKTKFRPFVSKDGTLNLEPEDEQLLRDFKISPE